MIVNKKECDTGFLKIIMGPMFSGKTSCIIELNRKYSLTDMKILVINYAEDKRYSSTMLSTHDKIMIPCLNILKMEDIFKPFVIENMIRNINDYDVILINEAQFMPDLKEYVIELVEDYNKIVYIFGLDGDFKRDGFKQMMELIPYADEIEKKYAICKNCKDGTRALFSHRLTSETDVKVIGSDNYIPLCRKCYLDKTS